MMADVMLGRRSVSKSVSSEPKKATRAFDPEIERPGQSGSGGRI
jgi:hypothetical protein